MKRYFFLGLGLGFILCSLTYQILGKFQNNKVGVSIKEKAILSSEKKDNNNTLKQLEKIIKENPKKEDVKVVKKKKIVENKKEFSIKEKKLPLINDLKDLETEKSVTEEKLKKNSDTEKNEDFYFVQFRASKHFDYCLWWSDKIKGDISSKIIKTKRIYRLITKEVYNFEEASEIARKIQNKYDLNTYINPVSHIETAY